MDAVSSGFGDEKVLEEVSLAVDPCERLVLMDAAFRVATRMAMLHRGKIIEQGTPVYMRQSPNPVPVQFLSGNLDGPIQHI